MILIVLLVSFCIFFLLFPAGRGLPGKRLIDKTHLVPFARCAHPLFANTSCIQIQPQQITQVGRNLHTCTI